MHLCVDHHYLGEDAPDEKMAAGAAPRRSRHFKMKLSKEPFWLTDKLVFLGEIERLIDFENTKPVGKVHSKTGTEDDYVVDDTAFNQFFEIPFVVLVD